MTVIVKLLCEMYKVISGIVYICVKNRQTNFDYIDLRGKLGT